MITLKYIIRKGQVAVRVTNNRKSAELTTGISMTADELQNAISPTVAKKNNAQSKFLHSLMTQIEMIKMRLIETGQAGMDVKMIKGIIKREVFGLAVEKESEGEFVNWFKRFAETHPKDESKTYKCYMHTLSRLTAFEPEINRLNFADINVGWLEAFDMWMKRTMGVNSRNHHMRNIRAVFKYALRNDVDLRNPFDRMKLKTEETAKRSLTVEELRRIIQMDVLPYAEIYRDMFVLSFMLIGINPVDLYNLESVTSAQRVEYRRAKTHKLYSVKVEPEAMAIIEKYRGDKGLLLLADRWKLHESFAAATNNGLQTMGAPRTAPNRGKKGRSAFPRLTMYWARHTWATIAAELDIPDAVISSALGHGAENPTTGIYIHRNRKKVDDANRRVLDWVLYDKR